MAHVQDRRYRVDADGKRHRTAYTGEKPFRVRYRGPDGTEHSESFALKRDATRFASGVDTDQARGNWVDPRLGRMTMAEWVKVVDPTLTGLRTSTRARDESYVRNHVLPEFGQVPLAALDHMAIQRWVAALEKEGYAPETVKKAVQLLNRYLKEAVRAGRLASNPSADIRLPKNVRREMRFLDPTQVARLTGAMDTRFSAIVTLGAYSGLRIGEMLGLRVGRVDMLRGSIEVVEQLQEVRGHLAFGPPKTSTSHRRVKVPAFVMDALRPHLEGKDRDTTVFLAAEGGLIRLNQWRRRSWNPAVEAAGLAPLRIHDLRHTAVALWIASGATPNEIAKRAGHSSVAVVLDRYGHLFPGTEDSVNERLEMMAREAQREASAYGNVVALGR